MSAEVTSVSLSREPVVAIPTTTLTTIAVRAEPHTTIVISMLKSIDCIELRIDEMMPKLLSIGSTLSENAVLLKCHNDLFARLADKQQQVEDLLSRAEHLVNEQKSDDDVAVYKAMAESLCLAWKELSRKLELRGYILEDTYSFYKIAEEHQKLMNRINSLINRIQQRGAGEVISLPKYFAEVKKSFKDFVELTASGMDIGSSIITQSLVLGQLADNDERPQETVKSSLLIEDVMLRMAQNWEIIDEYWYVERPKLEQLIGEVQFPSAEDRVASLRQRLDDSQEWLDAARERSKAIGHGEDEAETVDLFLKEVRSNEKVLKKLVHEIQRSSSPQISPLISRCGELLELYDLLHKRMVERQQLVTRTRSFFQNAETLPHQLLKIRSELEIGNSSIAGELGPLAQQKAITVIDEGQFLIDRLGNEHPAVPVIAEKLKELKILTTEVVQFARSQITQPQKSEGSERLSTQISNLESWIECVANSFLSQNIDLKDPAFLSNHKKFFTEVVIKEHEVNAIFANFKKLPISEQERTQNLQSSLEGLKSILDTRIQLGSKFAQVSKLKQQLGSTFQALSSLMDSSADAGNEQEIRTLIQSAQENFFQEKHQAIQFTSMCEEIIQKEEDKSLVLKEFVDSVKASIESQKLQLEEIVQQWQSWERSLVESKNRYKMIVEEIEGWRTEMEEFIRILEIRISPGGASIAKDWQPLLNEIESTLRTTQAYNEQLTEVRTFIAQHSATKEQNQKMQQLLDGLQNVQNRLGLLEQEVTRLDQKEQLSQQEQSNQPHALEGELSSRFIPGLEPAEVPENQFLTGFEKGRLEVSIQSIKSQKETVSDTLTNNEPAFDLETMNSKTVPPPPTPPKPQTPVSYKGSETNFRSTPNSQFSSPANKKFDSVINEMRRSSLVFSGTTELEEGPVGYSSIANAPEFIRPFQPEYTVEEGEKCQLDCLMLGNPRPKVQWLFNDQPARSGWQNSIEFTNVGDTYSISFCPARLEHAGYYRVVAENVRGRVDSLILVHVRPRSMIPRPHSRQSASLQRSQQSSPIRGILRQQQHQQQKDHQQQNGRSYSTPPQPLYCSPPLSSQGSYQQMMSASAYQSPQTQEYGRHWSESPNKLNRGQPPHFIQTIVSCVINTGDTATFEAVVTGWPAPEILWSKDGVELSPKNVPQIRWASAGGRVSITIAPTYPTDAGKYMCTARNSSGVATSSAQLVIRPRTMAPDFAWRLVSQEVAEGEQLKWTVMVIGDPEPSVTWSKDGEVIRKSARINFIRDAPQLFSLIIDEVWTSDAGQITCLLENSAGEARSTADLLVRPPDATPGTYIHITKFTQEKQVRGEEVARAESVTIEPPDL